MSSADFQSNDVIEYTGRKEKKENTEKYLTFINPETKKEKKVKIGVGLDFFFLGFFAFLFRGFIKEFFLCFFLLFLFDAILLYFNVIPPDSAIAGAIGVLLALRGNFYIARSLSKKGWTLKEPSDQTREYARTKWKNLCGKKRDTPFEVWLCE